MKLFIQSILRCTKYFAIFTFVALSDYKNILTTKISRFTVVILVVMVANSVQKANHEVGDSYLFLTYSCITVIVL